jgi:Cu/Ag efflux protein CusF
MNKISKIKSGIVTALFLVSIMLPVLAIAATENIEGGIQETAAAVATVIKIDKENRVLTLKDGDKTFDFTAGPEVRNFDQIKRGDQVLVEYYTGLAIEIKPKKGGEKERSDKILIERAKKGDKPSVMIQHTVTATGVVKKVDTKHRLITVEGTQKTLELKVAESVDLSKFKPGDQVEAVYVSLYSIAVEPAPKVSGTIKMKATAVAAGIGVEWGSGTLTMYDGSTHTFKVSGLSVIDVGITTIEAEGEVYHLVEAKDLEGTYMAGSAGATFVAGGSAATMKNGNGVVLKLKSTQKGLRFTLAPGGVRITDVK